MNKSICVNKTQLPAARRVVDDLEKLQGVASLLSARFDALLDSEPDSIQVLRELKNVRFAALTTSNRLREIGISADRYILDKTDNQGVKYL